MKGPAHLLAVAALAAAAPAAEGPELDEIVARHVEARGGAERWAEVETLVLTGSYATFSDDRPFTLLRARGDLFRLDFGLLGGEAVRARDAEGAWWQHPLMQPGAARLTAGPYQRQIERESVFGPLLIDPKARGVVIALVGATEVEGIPVIELAVTLADGSEESWFLDAGSYLEVAVDSRVSDHTQSPQPMRQRAFYDDFRPVDGLVVPFRVDYEFGHRLESMTVEQVVVDGEIDRARFSPPAGD